MTNDCERRPRHHYCPDCRRPTSQPDLCLDCVDRLHRDMDLCLAYLSDDSDEVCTKPNPCPVHYVGRLCGRTIVTADGMRDCDQPAGKCNVHN